MIFYEDLSELQKQAYNIAIHPKEKVTRIVGYAGTGKTTVLACVAREYGNKCIVLTPTNKASIVLKEKKIKAQTIHSFLYAPIEMVEYKKDKEGNILYQKDSEGNELVNEDGERLAFVAKKELQFAMRTDHENIPRIALIDEASMIGSKIFVDLCMVFDFIILFGDGFQLPPVKDKDILNGTRPDIFLSEVHRVAMDNPITRFATDIRNGLNPSIRDYMIEHNSDKREICYAKFGHPKLFQSIIENQAQVICYSNSTRHNLNNQIRSAKGYSPNTLMAGEPVVCLENWREMKYNDNDERMEQLVFYNGQIVETETDNNMTNDNFVALPNKIKGYGTKFILPFWNHDYFSIADDSTRWWNEFQRRKLTKDKPVRGIKMDYSYAITAHKAQGSEYDVVAIMDERSKVRDGHAQRWYYTAITRAKQRLLLIDCG